MIRRIDRIATELPPPSEPDPAGAAAVQECKPHIKRGDHLRLYRFSPKDYLELSAVFNGPHPETGEDLVVVDEPPAGVPPHDLPSQPAVFAPDYAPEDIAHIAAKLRKQAGLSKEPTGEVADGTGSSAKEARSNAETHGRLQEVGPIAREGRRHRRRGFPDDPPRGGSGGSSGAGVGPCYATCRAMPVGPPRRASDRRVTTWSE